MVFLPHVLVACSAPEVVPPELAALEQNKASLPAGTPGDPHPETLQIVSGGDSELWWAHGAGYIDASPLDVWTALLDPDVGVDRREVDEWDVLPPPEPDPELDASYIVHQVVNDVITVEYDMWWRHEVQVGTAEEPELVIAVWSKTDGTSFIDLLEYSMALSKVEDDVTQVEVIGHLKAALRDDETVAQVIQDLYDSLVAVAHGEPLPTY